MTILTAERAGNGPSFALRNPNHRDGAALHDLVAACPPLDLNSAYAYLLVCRHHGATSVVAESVANDATATDSGLAAAITAYVPPAQPDTLFVWQVAVAERHRGQGLGHQMLQYCIDQTQVRWLETSISPSNQASRQLFTRFAAGQNVDVSTSSFFSASDFGEGQHEEEILYRIGPWQRNTS